MFTVGIREEGGEGRGEEGGREFAKKVFEDTGNNMDVVSLFFFFFSR